jgi:asparagine synthetase B (glutamine-hydrolysing)
MRENSIIPGLNSVLSTISGEIPNRFFILGKTNIPLPSDLEEKAKNKGCMYLSWSYGAQGTIFLLTNHLDVAQSEEMLVLKLGFAHSPSWEALDARALMERGSVTHFGINHEDIHGNTLIVGVNRQKPSFSIFQSLTATSQAFYWEGGDTLLLSDSLRLLIRLVSPLELNAEAVPYHFLFRSVHGKMTYFKNIHKLHCGHIARYRNNGLHIEQLVRLDDWMPKEKIKKVLPSAVRNFDEIAECVIGSYIQWIKKSSKDLLVLLSGGVDSSLLTSYIRANLHPQSDLCSASYTIEAGEFEAEIEYAQNAVTQFNTSHQFLPISSREYASLLEQFIDLTVQPVENEQDPCYLALVKEFSGRNVRYLFSGSASDTLLGYESSKCLSNVERFRRVPYSPYLLNFLAGAFKHVLPNKAFGLQETAFLIQTLPEPASPYHPMHRNDIFTNVTRVNQCFGTEVISGAMNYRLAEFEIFSKSKNCLESPHLIGLTHSVHDNEIVMIQLFRSFDLELVHPYLDSAFVQAVFSFDPMIRYCHKGHPKWLPKLLLEKKLPRHNKMARNLKRAGGFDKELRLWMKNSVLKDMVRAIQRPGYMTRAAYNQAVENPDWFTWNLLVLDLFQKRILTN